MNNIKLVGAGYAIPEHCISNDDLASVVDTSDEWIYPRTGIKTRYVSTSENTSDLGYRAARNAIENAQIDVKEIDLIIVATITPDNFTPSCACLIQEKLGLNECAVMAFDISAACSGFVYALQVASAMLSQYKCALVIGSETLSKIIDWQDRNTCVLFGDGAGAAIVKQCENSKRYAYYARSIGDNVGTLRAKGCSLNQTPLVNSEKNFGYMEMDGAEVFRFAVKAMEEGIREVLAQVDVALEEVDYIIPHQANVRIIRNVAKRMKLAEDKFYMNVEKYGNTSAASVAIALAQAIEEKKVKEGMKLVLVGFGAGFTYAASYIEL